MEDILNLSKKFAKDFLNTDLYIKYKQYKQMIYEDEILLKEIDEYKALYEAFQNKAENNSYGFEEEKAVSRAYYSLIMNEMAKQFLECEQELSKAILKAYETISGVMDII